MSNGVCGEYEHADIPVDAFGGHDGPHGRAAAHELRAGTGHERRGRWSGSDRLEATLKGEQREEVAFFDVVLLHPDTTGLFVAFAAIAVPAFPGALIGIGLAVLWPPASLIWFVAVVGFFWYGLGLLMDRQLSTDPTFSSKRLPRAVHVHLRMLQVISPIMLLLWTFKFLQDHYGYGYWGAKAFHFLPWYEDRNLWFALVWLAWSGIGTFTLIRDARKWGA